MIRYAVTAHEPGPARRVHLRPRASERTAPTPSPSRRSAGTGAPAAPRSSWAASAGPMRLAVAAGRAVAARCADRGPARPRAGRGGCSAGSPRPALGVGAPAATALRPIGGPPKSSGCWSMKEASEERQRWRRFPKHSSTTRSAPREAAASRRGAARGQADLAGRRADPRAAPALPASTPPRSTTWCSASSPRSATRAPTSPGPPRCRRPAGDGRRRAAQPLLRLRPRGRQHAAARRCARAGTTCSWRAASSRCHGCRWASDGGAWAMDPETLAPLRAAGHRRRPHRHARGLHPRDVDAFAVESQQPAARPGRTAASRGPSSPCATATASRSSTATSTPPGHHAGGLGQARALVRRDRRAGGFDAVALRGTTGWSGSSTSTTPGTRRDRGRRRARPGRHEAGARAGLTPRARVVAFAITGADPRSC